MNTFIPPHNDPSLAANIRLFPTQTGENVLPCRPALPYIDVIRVDLFKTAYRQRPDKWRKNHHCDQ